MFVVIVGMMFENKTIHGPFPDHDTAYYWTIRKVGHQHYEIIPLEKP